MSNPKATSPADPTVEEDCWSAEEEPDAIYAVSGNVAGLIDERETDVQETEFAASIVRLKAATSRVQDTPTERDFPAIASDRVITESDAPRER